MQALPRETGSSPPADGATSSTNFLDDELREDDLQLAVFGFQQERFRRGALLVISVDERGEEDVGIDDDALHVRCALSACVLRGRLSLRRWGRA